MRKLNFCMDRFSDPTIKSQYLISSVGDELFLNEGQDVQSLPRERDT